MQRLLATGGDLALLGLALAALATVAGRSFWMLDLASHFQHYYAWAAGLLLILNLVLRRRRAALVSVALLGLAAFHLLPYYLPRSEVAGAGVPYKAMLLNLNLHNQKTAAVRAEIAANDPDILVLQEVTPRWRDELKALPAGFKHSLDLPERGAFGMWILSKFELEDQDVQRRDGVAFLLLKYQVEGRTLAVVALHPLPPVGAAASRTRNAILADAAVNAAGEGGRIAIGDFNCSPWSPYFRHFLKVSGLRDSALGRGVHGTWMGGLLPGIPIDHVLVSPDIEVLDREVGNDVGSDHRAVVVKFQFSKQP